MKSKLTLLAAMAFAVSMYSCNKNSFSEQDALNAQKDLLDLKYQHELDLETLKQKGATALQDLINTAALQQLKTTDSLTRANAAAAKRQDYTVNVVDAVTNAPIGDADVTVSSEGKVYAAKTNAQGSVTFTGLTLYPTSPFLISKTGYAATQIQQLYVAGNTAKLWNTADQTNEITGNLYIETDLTNTTPEKVSANVLVTASASIPSNIGGGTYTVYFPTYTAADGTYSLKLPAAPYNYVLSFQQVMANQKLFVNATEDDASTTFPNSLPRATTVTTYFNVNRFNATIPSVTTYYYFKFAADNSGKNLYIPGGSNNYYYGYNPVYVSPVNGKYQVERLNINNPYTPNGTYINYTNFTYPANSKIDVQLVDVAGNLVQNAPKLTATTDANGKIISYYDTEGGSGLVHLKRDDSGNLVADAKGVILNATNYDSYSNTYWLNFSANLNTATYNSINNSIPLTNKADKKIVNFYYGAGDSRAKQVY